jgi:hypothetical protein
MSRSKKTGFLGQKLMCAQREKKLCGQKRQMQCAQQGQKDLHRNRTQSQTWNRDSMTAVKQTNTWHDAKAQAMPWHSNQAKHSWRSTKILPQSRHSTQAHTLVPRGTILTTRIETVRTRVAKSEAVWAGMLSTSRNLSHQSRERSCSVNVGVWLVDVGPARSRRWTARSASKPHWTPEH